MASVSTQGPSVPPRGREFCQSIQVPMHREQAQRQKELPGISQPEEPGCAELVFEAHGPGLLIPGMAKGFGEDCEHRIFSLAPRPVIQGEAPVPGFPSRIHRILGPCPTPLCLCSCLVGWVGHNLHTPYFSPQ